MNYNQMNKYILHYIEEDLTHSAIMITGRWGAGKSYYIKNSLAPFLSSMNKNCIIISLYGINELHEISTSIFLEAQLQKANKLKERIKNSKIYDEMFGDRLIFNQKKSRPTAKILAKTVCKGVLSHFGIDYSLSNKDLNQLYRMVNLNNTIIIIEDLERTKINLLDVIGYINNLVEQDGLKVLVVANENELIECEEQLPNEGGKHDCSNEKYAENESRILTNESRKYLQFKEKTINDTIRFEQDFNYVIPQIIDSFNNVDLRSFSKDNYVELIKDIFKENDSSNLRSFIFACQKAIDIFNNLNGKYADNLDFKQTIFLGILQFSLKIKAGSFYDWVGDEYLSVKLGSQQFPLFRFCYDYIYNQTLNINQFESTLKCLIEYRLYDSQKIIDDNDYIIIRDFLIKPEKEVIQAVHHITNRLQNPNDIAFHVYGRLAYNLISINYYLGIDVKEAEKLLVANLKGRKERISELYLFALMMADDTPKQIVDEFELIKERMEASLNYNDNQLFGFEYKSGDIKCLNDVVKKKIGEIMNSRYFITRFDFEKTIHMIESCSSEEIYEFRNTLNIVYNHSNVSEYYSSDKKGLSDFFTRLSNLDKSGFDKIQELQYEYLVRDIQCYLSKL